MGHQQYKVKKGFIAHVMNINPHVIIVDCMIRRGVLVSKCLTHELLKSMNQEQMYNREFGKVNNS